MKYKLNNLDQENRDLKDVIRKLEGALKSLEHDKEYLERDVN